MNETGSVKLDAQPVDVVDFTGLVTGVEVFDPETPIAGIGGDRAIVRGQAMYIQWTGGACESRTRITFVPKDDGYELRIKADSTLAGMIGCPAVGVIRAIVIEIRESIEGKPLRTVFQYASLE